jgi:hypothetical protein
MKKCKQVRGVESTKEKMMFGQLVWGKKIWTLRAARNFQNAKTGELPSTLPRVSSRMLLISPLLHDIQ